MDTAYPSSFCSLIWQIPYCRPQRKVCENSFPNSLRRRSHRPLETRKFERRCCSAPLWFSIWIFATQSWKLCRLSRLSEWCSLSGPVFSCTLNRWIWDRVLSDKWSRGKREFGNRDNWPGIFWFLILLAGNFRIGRLCNLQLPWSCLLYLSGHRNQQYRRLWAKI